MSEPGWYADPGGEASMYRYWDGQEWGSELTDSPSAPAPGVGSGSGFDPSKPLEVNRHPDVLETGKAGTAAQDRRSGSAAGWVILAALVVVAVLAIGFLVRQAITGAGTGPSNPTAPICPIKDSANASQDPHPNDGRVYGGKLSFPLLGTPWGSPKTDDRVPFGRDARSQDVYIERNYQPGQDWVASILVAQLATGDGFATPEQAIETVSTCIVGAFYGDNKVDREDRENKATTIAGRDAWYLDMHLSFDIPGLKAKGEEAIIVIVRTAPDEMSIYYASIPDNAAPGLLKTGYDTIKKLTVS